MAVIRSVEILSLRVSERRVMENAEPPRFSCTSLPLVVFNFPNLFRTNSLVKKKLECHRLEKRFCSTERKGNNRF